MYDNILSIIDAIPVVEDWKTKVTRADKVTPNPFPGFDAEFVFRIEPRGAKLNKVIDQMAAESPRYKKIFGNLTTSRSALLKILTDRGEGDPTELANAKAAAIKAFYRAQLPLINKIKEDLKAAYPDKDFIFNPQAFLYSGRGDTEWEGYMYTVGTAPPPPPEDISSPEDIVVGSDPVVPPPSPEPPAPPPAVDVPPPSAAAPEEPGELVKVEKHILSRPEIDAIIDEIVVKLGLNPNTDLIVNNNAAEALSEYQDMRIGSNLIEVPTVEVSDSYNTRNPTEEINDTGQGVELNRELPNVIAYIQTTKGRKVTSRDEWMKLMQGRQPTGLSNPETGNSRRSEKLSRYGAPIAKEIRRQQEKTRTYDEIAVYADIDPAKNRFTGQARKWGGEVRYTFFIIVPKESWVPKSKLKKKN